MRRSLLISSALHVLLVLVLWLGLPVFLPPPVPMQLVPVEITDVAAITNTRIKPTPAPQNKPPPLPTPAEQATSPPPTPQSNPVPPPPQPPKEPEPEALPEKPAEIKKPEAKKPEPKKPEEKPKPKPDLLASVLKNVAKIQPKSASKVTKPEPDEEESEPELDAPSLSTRLTVSEEDALRRQIGSCWNVPIGARNAEELVVQVLITVNPDRTVQSAKVVDQLRMAGDPFFRAAAEAAVRALRHPLCTPLALPPDKYEQWKVIRFNFDPRDML